MVFIKEMKKHGFLLEYLIARDFKIKYRRSVLGIAWSVLNPLFMMLIVSTVFKVVFRINLEGYSYPVYVIIGQTMFNFLSEATNTSMQSILVSASLIKKVYIPKYIFPLEKVSFSFVNFAVSMVAVIIVGLIENIGISWHILLVPLLLITFYFFCLGLGLVLSVLAVFFRDTLHIYGIILTAWMYLTPVFYTLDNIGIRDGVNASFWRMFIEKVFIFNPMCQYITVFRDLVLYHRMPGILSILLCVGYAAVIMLLGTLFFAKKQDEFILHI